MQKRMMYYGRPKVQKPSNSVNRAGKGDALDDPMFQCLFGSTVSNPSFGGNTIDDKEAYERELFGHTISTKFGDGKAQNA